MVLRVLRGLANWLGPDSLTSAARAYALPQAGADPATLPTIGHLTKTPAPVDKLQRATRVIHGLRL